MEPWQSCCAVVCYERGGGKRRIKQTAGVNLQQQTNHLCAHRWSRASFVRGVSIKGFAHSHPLPGVILRQLVFASLTTNSNKDASVKAMVETSGDMQEQEEKISAPLKGSCSHEKPIWDPEGLGALGESNEAYEDSLCLEQQLGKRQLQHCPRTSHALPYSFRGIWQGYSNTGMVMPVLSQSLSLGKPSGPERGCDRTMHCVDVLFPWMLPLRWVC